VGHSVPESGAVEIFWQVLLALVSVSIWLQLMHCKYSFIQNQEIKYLFLYKEIGHPKMKVVITLIKNTILVKHFFFKVFFCW